MEAESKEFSSEQLSAAIEILKAQELENMKKVYSNPSAIALENAEPNTGDGLAKVRKTTRQFYILYSTNQFVSRGVNVRADTLVSKGYKIVGGDEVGKDKCTKLITNSGGKNLFWQQAINGYISGKAPLEKVYNESKTEILKLKHIHPLTIGYKTDEASGRIIVDEKTKEPVGYVQIFLDKEGKEEYIDIDKDIVADFKFYSIGDEFNGVSLLQSGYNTIVRLMNMEHSAAEAAIRTANPLIVAVSNSSSPLQIAQWAQILGRINGKEQIIIPKEMELKFLSPGPQNFNDYASYFLDAVVSAVGVPKSVLLGDSGSGNRAEGVVLTRHFYSAIAGDQQSMAAFYNNIFKEYGEIAGFEPPTLEFGDIAEDASLSAKSAIELLTAGIISREEARAMIGLEGGNVKIGEPSEEKDLKKSDMETAFPADEGKASGSQSGVKDGQKSDPFSKVSPMTE